MAQSSYPHERRPWATSAAFLLLCLLLAVGAMRSDLFPTSPVHSAPELEREAVPLALLSVVAAVYCLIRGAVWPRGGRLGAAIALGLGLFVVPAVLVHLSQEWVSAFTRVAVFSLTPVFAVVLEPYIGANSEADSQSHGGLIAALAAVAGVLCIFPVDLPGTLQGGIAMAAVVAAAVCVAVANCIAVRLATTGPALDLGPMAALAGASAVLGLLAASAFTGGIVWRGIGMADDLAWAASVTLPGLVLLFWLMPRLTAARMTARFVVAPLFAVLISIGLNRPALDVRTGAGLLLMVAGAVGLLYARERGEDSLRLNR